ncbi:Osmotin thaumatin-like protein [Panus rudis PR-1116 ss-1]|nr:Osmotin thaumatin-like protein [Panus rudis PR-1116 ss-1]
MKTLAALASFAALVASASARSISVVNSCSFTIWPALFTDLNAGTAVPDQATGWEAAPNTRVTFNVPDNWKSGRIWGRRNCNFSDPNPATQCSTGGCTGGLECDPHTGTGAPPLTLAEFTLLGDGGQDYYDVSLVNGLNLPVKIDNNKGCRTASCPVDLNPNCPDPLKGPFDSSGAPVGCKSACMVDPKPSDSANCCSGSHNTPATCPASGVQYYSYFKGNCPNSYVYAYDESNGTPLWTCSSSAKPDYTVTFCP